MKNHSITAKIISFEKTQVIPFCEIVDRVKQGEVIVVSQLLQSIGYFERLRLASIEGIAHVIGREKAVEVQQKGFEFIHNIIGIDELDLIVNSSYEVFHKIAPDLAKNIVQNILKVKTPFYFEEYLNVRFHVPYDVVISRINEFSKFYWNGKVTAHGPHHDSWYYCPTNCINVWIALGPVTVGNGLTLYPEVYGKRLPCTSEGKILRDQYFGRSLQFELEPGDAIIFRGEHLHGSEINCTTSTRYVVSLRLTLEKPSFLGNSPYQEDYIYVQNQNKLFSGLKEFFVNSVRITKKIIKSFANNKKPLNYVISPLECPFFEDTSDAFPKILPILNIEQDLPQKLEFDPEELPTGTIKPIAKQWCIARTDEYQVIIFSRYCPHEGADLAAGSLHLDQLVCPWHNLPFNLNNGTSPCRSLSRLIVYCYYRKGEKSHEWQAISSNLEPYSRE